MWNKTLKFDEKGEVIQLEKKEVKYNYDDRLKTIWRERRKADYEVENQKFKEWCNTYVKQEESTLCFGDILASLYNKTLESLTKDGYYIKNKEFKDEFATLIYKESYIYE